MTLTLDERALAEQTHMAVEVLERIKHITGASLEPLQFQFWIQAAEQERSTRHTEEGLLIRVPELQGAALVRTLRPILLAKGCLVFIAATDVYDDPRVRTYADDARSLLLPAAAREVGLGVLPGTSLDDFLLRYLWKRCCHPPFVVKKLRCWQELCAYDLVEIGPRWLRLSFTTLPEDLYAFAADINYLAIDPHANDEYNLPAGCLVPEDHDKGCRWCQVEALVQEIRDTQEVLVWWDR